MFKSIYTLFNYFITQNIPEVKLVSLFSNQFQREAASERLPYPSVFIEITPLQANNWLMNVQYFEVVVNLHVVSEFYNTFDNNDKMLTSSFDHLSIVDKVYKELDNLSDFTLPEEVVDGDYVINRLQRTGIVLSKDFGVLKDSIISFRFLFVDRSKLDDLEYVEFSEATDFVTTISYDKLSAQ